MRAAGDMAQWTAQTVGHAAAATAAARPVGPDKSTATPVVFDVAAGLLRYRSLAAGMPLKLCCFTNVLLAPAAPAAAALRATAAAVLSTLLQRQGSRSAVADNRTHWRRAT